MPKVPPEIAFQNHVRGELRRRFKNDTLKYSALEQGDIMVRVDAAPDAIVEASANNGETINGPINGPINGADKWADKRSDPSVHP